MAYRPKLRPLALALSRIQSVGGMLPLSLALTSIAFTPQLASAQQAQNNPPTQPRITLTAAEGGESYSPAAQTMPEVRVQGQTDNDFAPGNSTVAKFPTPVRDIPQSVTVINHALMNSVGAVSLTDALQYVPGITIQSAEGGTIGNNINLNGYSAREDMFIDGFRDRGQYYRDTFDLEQVEVLSGASSMLFGRGSTAGVINQVTKQAYLGKSTDEVTGSVTSNAAVRSTLDINQQLSGTSAIRVNAFGQDWDTTRDVMSYKDFGVAPNLKFGLGTPTEITLSALLQHNDDMPDYGIPVAFAGTVGKPTFPAPISDKNAFYGATDDNTAQDIVFLNGEIKHAFSPAAVVRTSVQYNHYVVDVRESAGQAVGTVSSKGVFTQLTGTTFLTTPLADMYVRLQSHDRNIVDSSLFDQTDSSFKFNTGPFHHELLAGVEVGRDTYTNQAVTVGNGSCNGGPTSGLGGTGFACTPLLDPAYVPRAAGVTETYGNLVSASADTLAGYVNDTVSFAKYFKVVAGVRHDDYTAEDTNTITNATTLPYYSQAVNFNSVRTGLIFQPTQMQSYYVSYSTSFDPALEALTVTNGQQTTPPETNKAYEVGGKFDFFNENLSLTGALYKIEQNNTLNQIDTGVYENEGKTRVQGIRLGAAGRITSNWQIYAGYLVMNSKVISGPPTIATGGVITAVATTGNELANTPRETFTLWTTYDLTPAWQVGAGAISMSARYATTAQVAQVAGFAEFNAAVTYHPSKKYDIQLNLYNLTDKFYYINTAGGDGGRSVPGQGPTAMLTGRYRF